MDQNDKMSYGVWDLSRLKSSQSSKNHQTTDGFAAFVSDRNHLPMSASNSGASKFQEYPLMDGVIDMSSKVSPTNKVSVIKNSAEQSQKFSPTKNYARTREKAENAHSRLSPEGVVQNIPGDLQFKIFGSEVVRKETSHLVNNNNSPEKSHGHSQAGHFIQQNLNCRPANNHSQQQNSVFPDQARTYQKCNSKAASESEHVYQNFDHHENHIWNPAKDLSTERQQHNNRFSKNLTRSSNNGPTTPLLLSTVRSDVAMNSNDTKIRHRVTSTLDDDVQEVYSISDDSQGRVEMRVDMVEENAEVYSGSPQGEGSAKLRSKRTIIVRDSDPNEEVYFICEDGDEENDEVEMVDEDEVGEAEGNEEDEEGEETNNGDYSTAEGSHQNGEVRMYHNDRIDERYEDNLPERRRRGSAMEFSSPTRSRPRRGRRPRNSLVLSQSRLSTKQDHDADSEEGSLRFSSPGRRRGRGRGTRRGWSTRGGRGASASKRARPMKRSSSVRMAADAEEDSKKAKKARMANMFIADKISSAVAAAASATQSSQVMEYQWPKGKNGEWYVLQEHVSEFLAVVSFKRKYPDISRRPVEYQERQFLCEQGCVTEMQCDLGLTALKAEEVLDLMARDYPEKYQEYLRGSRKKLKVTEKPAEKNSTEGTSKAESLLKRAMKSAMDFNSALLRERRSERQTYFDLQTLEIHHPIRRSSVKYSSVKLCNSYPVAVVPGQFQEYYKSYTPEELKYFPINTALYAPHKIVQSIYADPVETVSDEEEDRTNNNNNTNNSSMQNNTSSLSASKQGRPRTSILNRFPALEKSEIDLNGSDSNLSFSSAKKTKRGGATPGKPKKPVAQQAKCGMCNQTNRNKYNEPDELVRCNSCAVSNHPGCLGLSREMVPVIKTYNWQCMECKTCFKCTEPHDEDKMMFCDHCDRGYHTYCVGVVSIPEGRWDCSMCIGKSSNPGRDSSLPSDFGSPSLASSAKAKLAETLAARPKPKRGRPFKYPRDENNVRIMAPQPTPPKSTSVADGEDSSRTKVDQSTFINISNQIAASDESADNNPALSSGPDQRSGRTFSTGGRISLPSTFSKSQQQQQGSVDLIEEGPSI